MADINQMLRELEAPTFGEASDAQSALSVLEQLEQQGNLRPAEAEALNTLRGQSAQNQDEISRTNATYRGALQGGTFQLADEIHGLLGGDKEAARAKNREAEILHPDEYATGRTAGALGSGALTAFLTGGAATGPTIWSTAGRGALIGGGEGVLWGFGGGEGAEDKLKQVGKFGGIGMGVGALAPLGVHGTVKTGQAVDDLVRGAFNAGNKPRAERAIMDALRKAQMTVGDASANVARASAQGQPQFRLMDALGTPGQRKASGVVRGGGEGAEEIAQFLQQRQLDQGDRVAEFLDDAFEVKGTTAQAMREQVKKNRKAVADSLFSQASDDALPVDTREAIQMLDDTIGQMSNSGIRPPQVVREYQKLRTQLAGQTPDGNPTTLSDYESVLGLWREVRDKVDSAFKTGNGAIGEALKPIRDSLQRSLEESSDLYRFATDNYREGSRVLDAFDAGSQMASRGRAADNVAALSGMTEQQQKAARIGYGDAVLNKIERNAAPTANKAKPLTSTKARTEADALAQNPGLLRDRIEREGLMWDTQNRALGGSRTADNLEDIADTGAMADAARATRDLSAGNVGNALSNVTSLVARKATGQNEATRQIIANLLLSADPKRALAGAMKREGVSQARKRIAESIVRALGRVAVD